jgi:hypothetical protein
MISHHESWKQTTVHHNDDDTDPPHSSVAPLYECPVLTHRPLLKFTDC